MFGAIEDEESGGSAATALPFPTSSSAESRVDDEESLQIGDGAYRDVAATIIPVLLLTLAIQTRFFSQPLKSQPRPYPKGFMVAFRGLGLYPVDLSAPHLAAHPVYVALRRRVSRFAHSCLGASSGRRSYRPGFSRPHRRLYRDWGCSLPVATRTLNLSAEAGLGELRARPLRAVSREPGVDGHRHAGLAWRASSATSAIVAPRWIAAATSEWRRSWRPTGFSPSQFSPAASPAA
jgi:hypothetical protein